VILDATGAVYRTTFTEGTGDGWQTWTSVGGVLADIAPAPVGGELLFAERMPGGDLYWWQHITETVRHLMLVELPCPSIAFHGVAPSKAQFMDAAEFEPITREFLYLAFPPFNLRDLQTDCAIKVALLKESRERGLPWLFSPGDDVLQQLGVFGYVLLFLQSCESRLLLCDALFILGVLELVLDESGEFAYFVLRFASSWR
jgi:hypothetical protein